MNVVYSVQARSDLHNIYEYIALTLLSPENAAATAKRIMSAARSLETMPERNPLYKDEPWRSKGVRFTLARNFMLFYTISQDTQTVSIARILYGGRDISHQLEETDW